jgi:hypothetical protein
MLAPATIQLADSRLYANARQNPGAAERDPVVEFRIEHVRSLPAVEQSFELTFVMRGPAKAMSTCHASSIVCDGRTLSWFGPEGASWNVPAERLRAIRELVAESGDVRWLVEFDIDGEDAALQSPANASGMDRALAALSTRLNAQLDLQLERAAVGNRVVWSR